MTTDDYRRALETAIREYEALGQQRQDIDKRQRLQTIGFDLSKYANDLAATHTILKRLNESGELRFIPHGNEPRKHAYLWNHGPHVVALGPDIAAFMRDAGLEREAMRARQEPVPPRSRARKTPRTTKRTRPPTSPRAWPASSPSTPPSACATRKPTFAWARR